MFVAHFLVFVRNFAFEFLLFFSISVLLYLYVFFTGRIVVRFTLQRWFEVYVIFMTTKKKSVTFVFFVGVRRGKCYVFKEVSFKVSQSVACKLYNFVKNVFGLFV